MSEMGFSIVLQGAPELTEALSSLGKRGSENAARAAVRQTTNILLRKVKERTPVETGILKAAWKTKIKSGRIITGHVFVDNKVRPVPRVQSQLKKKLKAGDFTWGSRKAMRFVKPKNPYLYARKVNETSKANKGFFDGAVNECRPELPNALNWFLAAEIRKRRLKTA